MQNKQFKNIKDIKDLPEKYQKILEDKNKNGKPDFFEDTPINIVKKLINLLTQKDPHLYGYQKFNPSTFQIVFFIIAAIAIGVFAIQFFPILIIFGVSYFLNKDNKKKQKKSLSRKLIQTVQNKNHHPQSQTQIPKIPQSGNNFQNSTSDAIRIVLFLGLIGYCVYLALPYLSDKF